MDYAELHCLSNFSFLRGASHPGELVSQACRLGYAALAITDECSVAGVVRALAEVRKQKADALGVPIFQEQVMQLAIVAAGFTAGEADELRRAMGGWERHGDLGRFEPRLIEGMRARGYEESFARRIFQQIRGFGEYGFPEAHAISFALLVYDSAWLKCHEPAAFTCALLNSQPMGFYQPAQLVRDAREHGVEVRPVRAESSDYDCTLERRLDGEPALRLGLCLVKSLSEKAAKRILKVRAEQPFASIRAAPKASLSSRSRTRPARSTSSSGRRSAISSAGRWSSRGCWKWKGNYSVRMPSPMSLPINSSAARCC